MYVNKRLNKYFERSMKYSIMNNVRARYVVFYTNISVRKRRRYIYYE